MQSSSCHNTVLERVFSEVLEEAAFMFTEPLHNSHGEVGGELLRADMDFRGQPSGTVSLMVPAELAAVVVANQLGFEADDPEIPTFLHDAVGELLNVTCNHFLTERWAERTTFHVTEPKVEVVDDADRQAWLTDSRALKLFVSGHPLWLRVSEEQA